MIFNSIDFAIFLPIVFILYWFVFNKNINRQNILLLVSSYIFYGWWDYRFLALIAFSTLVDYSIGLKMRQYRNTIYGKYLLLLSLIVNLGFLGYFKYYNFFIQSFTDAFTLLGYRIEGFTLNIILPVGISFYTFQTLSYTIDVYRNKMEPTKSLIAFSSYVSFFPQLVAGPIERATHLLPQFLKKRNFNVVAAKNGLRQILWGLFKKMVIADNCAQLVNDIFANYQDYSSSTLIMGALFFTFQIYCDFSGYSDIAIGTSRLFGFDLKRNFAYPYFSRDIAEFWRRWHISLSTWFRDYLYIPLGGSKGSKFLKIRNVFIIFLVSGFWHGANWTFIVWGALNAIYFLPLLLLKKNRANLDGVSSNKSLPSLREFFNMSTTFLLTVFAWIFFRSDSVTDAFNYIQLLFSKSLFTFPHFSNKVTALISIVSICFLIVIEWRGRNYQFGIENFVNIKSAKLRWASYYFIVILIILFAGSSQEFIYFQF